MSDFQFEQRVGYNEVENKFEVQLLVKNISSKDEALELGRVFKQQFREFIESRGGTATDVASSGPSVTRSGLILPN